MSTYLDVKFNEPNAYLERDEEPRLKPPIIGVFKRSRVDAINFGLELLCPKLQAKFLGTMVRNHVHESER